jgi:FtsP/CotA-like multicopper oxidase with cupredoxin domain
MAPHLVYGTLDDISTTGDTLTEKSVLRRIGTHFACVVFGVAAMASYQSVRIPSTSGPANIAVLAAVDAHLKGGTTQHDPAHKIVDAPKVSGGGGSATTSPDPSITYKDWSECPSNCGGNNLEYPTTIRSVGGNLEYTLKVTKARFEGPVSYTHRAYDGGITGPTFVVKAGDHVKIHLKNELEYPTQVEYSWTGEDYTVMTALGTCEPYGQPNVTSLHFHGLLVPTTGLGDGPFRMAAPGETITYSFQIDEDHPSGTFWYHSHYGMSHSLQTAGLMGGAFVVLDDNDDDDARRSYGNREPHKVPQTRGLLYGQDGQPEWDLGAALWAEIQAATSPTSADGEDIMLVQWGSFSSSFGDYNFLAECSHSNMPTNVVSYDEDLTEFGIVNGVYIPTVSAKVGQWFRWRMINGAAHRYVGMYSMPDTCDTYLLAADGVYYDSPRKVDYVYVSMGSRVDVLMKCTQASVTTLQSGSPDSFSQDFMDTDTEYEYFGLDPGFLSGDLLTLAIVENDSGAHYNQRKFPLLAAIERNLAKDDHSADLSMVMKHALPKKYFGLDHMDIDTKDLATYEATMSMEGDIVKMFYTMNTETFTERMQHRMRLNQPQEWTIRHVAGQTVDSEKSHNWHIHGFHFQIMYAMSSDNTTYMTSPTLDWTSGDWRDVVSVPRDGYVVVRFTPLRYAGPILHHCHVYNHETGGLKELVDVIDCSDEAKQKLIEVCTGGDDWPFAGFNCTSICNDDSMNMYSHWGANTRKV